VNLHNENTEKERIQHNADQQRREPVADGDELRAIAQLRKPYMSSKPGVPEGGGWLRPLSAMELGAKTLPVGACGGF
jgi:hypothetical protein